MTACRLSVRLTPRAARDEVLGFEGDVLRARVKAPPVEGRANDALLRLLAKVLGVRRSALAIVRGQTSRGKVVQVEGLDGAEVRRRVERAG
jgi:uncharacterized protein (TIGR00251 family)